MGLLDIAYTLASNAFLIYVMVYGNLTIIIQLSYFFLHGNWSWKEYNYMEPFIVN